MKHYIITLIVFLTVSLGLANNNTGVVILINGKIINNENNKPVATKVKFIDENGKIHSSSSNSIDGVFQQVLPSGLNYQVFFDGFLSDSTLNNIYVPKYSEYTELGYEFKVSEFKKGLIISANNFFEKNSDIIKPEAKKSLLLIKELTHHQKGLVFEAIINSADSYFPKKTVKESYLVKGKKKTKNVVQTNESQLNILLDKRKEALINLLNELQIHQKYINIKTELIVLPPKPKAKFKTKSKSKVIKGNEILADNLIIKIDKVIKF